MKHYPKIASVLSTWEADDEEATALAAAAEGVEVPAQNVPEGLVVIQAFNEPETAEEAPKLSRKSKNATPPTDGTGADQSTVNAGASSSVHLRPLTNEANPPRDH